MLARQQATVHCEDGPPASPSTCSGALSLSKRRRPYTRLHRHNIEYPGRRVDRRPALQTDSGPHSCPPWVSGELDEHQGAGQGAIVNPILSQGGRLIVGGLVVGLCGAFVVNRFYRLTMPELPLPGIQWQIGIAFALSFAGLLACYLPARRASRVDPAVASAPNSQLAAMRWRISWNNSNSHLHLD